MSNYIDIEAQEKDKLIYRITKFAYLKELFARKVNTLVKPSSWDDPNENITYGSLWESPSGEQFEHPCRNRAYGQCWTITPESNAMWQMHSQDNDGVRLQTTIRKLHNSLYSAQTSYARMSCFIGKVKYYQQQELRQRANDLRVKGGSIGQARSLLLKGVEYENENEIRLIYLEPRNQTDKDLYQYPCEPFNLIDAITFHPKMKPHTYEEYKDYLKGTGFRNAIDQSTLYKRPNLIIRQERN